jgi:hypothetical protein
VTHEIEQWRRLSMGEKLCMQWLTTSQVMRRESTGRGYCGAKATHSAPHPNGGEVNRCVRHAIEWDRTMKRQGGTQLLRLMRPLTGR